MISVTHASTIGHIADSTTNRYVVLLTKRIVINLLLIVNIVIAKSEVSGCVGVLGKCSLVVGGIQYIKRAGDLADSKVVGIADSRFATADLTFFVVIMITPFDARDP